MTNTINNIKFRGGQCEDGGTWSEINVDGKWYSIFALGENNNSENVVYGIWYYSEGWQLLREATPEEWAAKIEFMQSI